MAAPASLLPLPRRPSPCGVVVPYPGKDSGEGLGGRARVEARVRVEGSGEGCVACSTLTRSSPPRGGGSGWGLGVTRTLTRSSVTSFSHMVPLMLESTILAQCRLRIGTLGLTGCGQS
eukprot:5752576-Prymnesium_polylepis.1